MTRIDLPGKQASPGTLFGPWIDWPTCYYYRSTCTCTLSLDHSNINGNLKVKYDCAALTYLMAGSLMLRQTNFCIGFSTGKRQKCKDLGQNTNSLKYPIRHGKTRFDL